MLAVQITTLTPDAWGWTSSPAVPDSAVLRRLGLVGAEQAHLLWEIDGAAGTATANGKYTRSLAPFLGVTGVAPAGPGTHSTVPPRTEAGGNIDCKELTAGSTLYLPVNVDGGLLYLGDGHAAQGDGESCGTAIECGMSKKYESAQITDLEGHHPEGYDSIAGTFSTRRKLCQWSTLT
jgi:acetamidase/formamidase